MAAAFFVAFLVKNFAPEAKGHGVPEVLEAIYYVKGVVRPIVGVVKSVASALSIGSGGSAGREGPMIQIGASFGSTLGQWCSVQPWQRITLVAAGAGGGIAASFNTPVGGILFAVEIVMHELSVRTLVPVAIATVTATYVSRLVFGVHPSFIIPQLDLSAAGVTAVGALLCFVGLGIVMGLVSALFIKTLYGFEDFFEKRIRANYYVRHMGAMLLIGIMMYVMLRVLRILLHRRRRLRDGAGHPGRHPDERPLAAAVVRAEADRHVADARFGGLGRSLFAGLFHGRHAGRRLRSGSATGCFLRLAIGTPAFAVAGMAGSVGGATGAAMAAIVMIFEMTRDYNVIIPITITVALSYGIRRALCPKAFTRSSSSAAAATPPWALHADLGQVLVAKDIMRSVDTAERAALAERIRQPAEDPLIVAKADALLDEILEEMHRAGATTAVVSGNVAGDVSAGDILGVISERELAEAMIRSVELFRD